jgi:glycosyltransferase involved in cell wall biosynthesis
MTSNENGAPTTFRASLVVPCFNEGKRLDVAAFRSYLSARHGIRIIFVDDGSSDDTVEVLQRVCRGYEDSTHILKGGKNRGKAEAVRMGMLYALNQGDPQIVGFWDADLATPLEAVEKLLRILDARPDIDMVFGSRVKLLGRTVNRKPIRHYLGRIFATVVSVALGIAIYDTQCGAKLFRVHPDLREVLAEPFLSKWVFDIEILARYIALCGNDPARVEQMIYEFPLQKWTDVEGSKVRPKDFFVAISDVIRIRRKYRSGRRLDPAASAEHRREAI